MHAIGLAQGDHVVHPAGESGVSDGDGGLAEKLVCC